MIDLLPTEFPEIGYLPISANICIKGATLAGMLNAADPRNLMQLLKKCYTKNCYRFSSTLTIASKMGNLPITSNDVTNALKVISNGHSFELDLLKWSNKKLDWEHN